MVRETHGRRAEMKRILAAFLAVAVAIGGGVALASEASATASGPSSGAAVRKFQKDTFALRDELAAKQADLRDEYQKDQPDQARITALEKDVVDLETRIHAIARRDGFRSRGPRRGAGMEYGMGMGYGMMGYGGGPGSCGCW
jgi:hypothetical protein